MVEFIPRSSCRLALSVGTMLVSGTLLNAQVNPVPPSVQEWRRDVDDVVREIVLHHPDPFAKVGRLAFMRAVEAFKEALPQLTRQQRTVRAMRLVAALGDGHTQLEPDNPEFALWYPVRLYEFSDGVFVVSAHRSVADLAGVEVETIAGHPVREVLEQVRNLQGADNAFDRLERMYAVHNAGLMTGLGYAEPSSALRVRVRLRTGESMERVLSPSRADLPRFKENEATFEWAFRPEMYGLPFGSDDDWLSAFRGLPASAFAISDASRPAHLTDRLPFNARAFPDKDAFYIRTNYVNDTTFVPFFRKALAEVDSLRPRRLILDFRYNFGGDASQAALLIDEFIKRSDNKPWKELYILTGRRTYSAAIIILREFLERTQPTLVGEPPGSALNHFGDPIDRPFPHTGLRLSVSTLRHQLSSSDDVRDFLPVDVPAVFSFADYAAGRDAAVDPILRGDEMRSVPAIATSDGGSTARKVYADRKARFGHLPWWRPPTEIALRRAGDALLAQGHVAEALDTCTLNTEIHPDIWNVWYNLATAQKAAGLMKERVMSYRCVLEIDPNNFNGVAIRRLLATAGKDAPDLPPGCPSGASTDLRTEK